MKLVGINNNKGFTLVEILAVLVLIGLLFGLGVPAVSKISKNMKARTYNQKINLIEKAGELWGQDNKALLQETECDIAGFATKVNCNKISIEELIEADYLESEDKNTPKFDNPIDDSDLLKYYVYVYKKNNRVYAKFSGESSVVPIPALTYNSSNIVGTVPSGYIYKYRTGSVWQDYTGTVNVGSGFVAVKTCEEDDVNHCSDEVVLNGYKVETSDNIGSDNWHTSTFYISILAKEDATIKYSFDNTDYDKTYSSPIVISDSNYSTLNIKITSDGSSTTTSYKIRYDKEVPVIKSLIVDSYNTSNSIATLSAVITDDLGIDKYMFSNNTSCPSSSSSWVSAEHQKKLEINRKGLTSAFDGDYYLWVKDKKGNCVKKSIRLYNCVTSYSIGSSSCVWESSTYRMTHYVSLYPNSSFKSSLSVRIESNSGIKTVSGSTGNFSLVVREPYSCPSPLDVTQIIVSAGGKTCYRGH